MENNEEEIWKRCPGFEQEYDISNFGNVRSYHFDGRIDRSIVPREMTPNLQDYVYVTLTRMMRKAQRCALHILVAKAFVRNPDPKNKKWVMHLNDDKLDPRASNLKWGTAGENQKSAYDNGLRKKPVGALNGRAKLTESEAMAIFNSEGNHYKIASIFGIDRTHVGLIKSGKIWGQVTGKVFEEPEKKVAKLDNGTIINIIRFNGDHEYLGLIFGVSKSVISSIKTGRTHSDVTGIEFKGKKPEYNYYD